MPRLDRALLLRLATSERFERVVRALPRGEALAWRAAERYVAGTDQVDALRVADELGSRGIGASLDLFGEQVQDPETAASIAERYIALARELSSRPDRVWLSIDLSHIGADLSVELCRGQLERILEALPDGRVLQVGAEDAARTDRVNAVVLGARADRERLGVTLQANLRRSDEDAARFAQAGLHVRLVKGAYVESSRIARPWGEETDVAYTRLAHALTERRARFSLATHDRALREALLPALPDAECELLLGVRGEDAEDLVRRGRTVRLYVPFGAEWFRYWMRRVAEVRGA